MNRLVAAGLVHEVRQERQVIVVSDRPRRAWQEVVDRLGPEDDDLTVLRANGRERIDGPRGVGRLRFTTPQGLRGRTADLVYLDTYVHPVEAQAVVASTGGEVIRP